MDDDPTPDPIDPGPTDPGGADQGSRPPSDDDPTSDPIDQGPIDQGPTDQGTTDQGGGGAGADGGRPWYRRGGLWAWFVLVSAVLGWVLAGVAEDRLYAFDPDEAEVAAVCPVSSPLAQVSAWGDLSRGEPVDGERLAALEALAAAAPGTIADDVDEVRAAEAERQALLVGVDLADPDARARARTDVDALADRHRVALLRVDAYVEAACGYPVLVGVTTLG